VPRPFLFAIALLASSAIASGCSGAVSQHDIRSAEGSITGLTVSGSFGSLPVVRMAAPLRLAKTQTSVVVTGTGPPVQIDQLFVLQVSLYDARTGRRAASTYEAGQQPLLAKSTDDSLFPALSAALIGKRQGSRVVMALTARDAYGTGGTPPSGITPADPVVVVADIAAVPPAATVRLAPTTSRPATGGLPGIVASAGVPSGLDLAGSRAPDRLVVVTLVKGTGPKVRDHSLITVDYLGQGWGSKVPFDDTYFKDPAIVPIGTEQSLPAWDQALVGVRRGSRVLVLAPADLTREPTFVDVPPRATIGWVVDVLGVS
jgi:peptidylprolyl isomerase